MRPNILFILADDLGQGDVSCFNSTARWSTPQMDRLADDGLRMFDSHATSAVCTPSRYSCMTGRYNWRSRLKSSVLPGDSMALIEQDRLTLPKFLQNNGYRTAVVGKWHLGLDWQLRDCGEDYSGFGVAPPHSPNAHGRMGREGNFDPSRTPDVEGLDIDYAKPVTFGPNQLGFDYSFITAASLDQPPYVYVENGQPLGVPTAIGGDQRKLDRRTDSQSQQIQQGPMVPGYDVQKVASDFQSKAQEVLAEFLDDDEPWFMYVPSHLVHGPLIPDRPWQGASGQGSYGDFVLQFDSYVGQLVDQIDAAGAGEDTIVIVTSDNGASGVAGLDRLRAAGHDPSNGWRGHKSDIWEGGHREPFIVRWPGRIEPGTVSHHLVSHSDIFATVADLLDVVLPADAGEDSVSNLPLWQGAQEPVREELVSSSFGGGFAFRRGAWKLEFTSTGDGMDDVYAQRQGGPKTEYIPAQLYDLDSDPAESRNLIDSEPARVRDMSRRMAQIIADGRSTPGPRMENSAAPGGTWHQMRWADDVELSVDEA